jgi:hypothetical protein
LGHPGVLSGKCTETRTTMKAGQCAPCASTRPAANWPPGGPNAIGAARHHLRRMARVRGRFYHARPPPAPGLLPRPGAWRATNGRRIGLIAAGAG